uniref:Uncharacterized protein n=1 Tax=Cacopsylla melanoneura TaxID=428564 RepID=A0A8D8Z5C7_9HEMI
MACFVLKLFLLGSVCTLNRAHENIQKAIRGAHENIQKSTRGDHETIQKSRTKEKVQMESEIVSAAGSAAQMLNGNIWKYTFFHRMRREISSTKKHTTPLTRGNNPTTLHTSNGIWWSMSDFTTESSENFQSSEESRNYWKEEVASKVTKSPINLTKDKWKSHVEEYYFRREASSQLNFAHHFFQEVVVNYTTTPKVRRKRTKASTLWPKVSPTTKNGTRRRNFTRRKNYTRSNRTRKTGTWSPYTRRKQAEKREKRLLLATEEKIRQEIKQYSKAIKLNRHTMHWYWTNLSEGRTDRFSDIETTTVDLTMQLFKEEWDNMFNTTEGVTEPTSTSTTTSTEAPKEPYDMNYGWGTRGEKSFYADVPEHERFDYDNSTDVSSSESEESYEWMRK